VREELSLTGSEGKGITLVVEDKALVVRQHSEEEVDMLVLAGVVVV
jgi:hypothetical protein